MAFCEARKHHRSDAGDIDLVLRRSFDAGKTWGPMQTVWDDGENTCGNPCPVIDQESGTIWLPMTWNKGEDTEDKIIAAESKHPRRPYLCYSSDDGETWSKPVNLSETCRDPEWGWYATGPGVAIQLQRGQYKGRLVCPANHSSRKYQEVIDIFDRKVKAGYGSHVIYSDDRGKTWRRSEPIRPGCNESQVVELVDGTLMMNMRSYQPRGLRSISTSTDGGATWTAAWQHKELPEPTCQASFLRYTTVEDGGKNRLLFSNPPNRLDLRVKLTVKLSYDEGKTWPISRLIYQQHSDYSCLTVLPDKSIGIFYGRDKYSKLTFARFTLQWLSRGQDSVKADR